MQRDGHQALVIDFLSVLRERGSFGKIKVVKQSSQVPSAVSLTLQMGLFHLPCCHTFTPSSLLHSSSSSSSSPNPPVVPDFLLLPFAYLLGSFISPDAQMTLLKNSRARLLVFRPAFWEHLTIFITLIHQCQNASRAFSKNEKIFQSYLITALVRLNM